MEASGRQWCDQERVSLPTRVICLISLDFLLNQPAPLARQPCRRGCKGLPRERRRFRGWKTFHGGSHEGSLN